MFSGAKKLARALSTSYLPMTDKRNQAQIGATTRQEVS